MSINASLQQIAGGIAAAVAGVIVVQNGKATPLLHYDIVGYVVVAITALCLVAMARVKVMAKRKAAAATSATPFEKEMIMEV